ncbi:MAG: stage V sporulation protein AD [Syntrophomonadaceae bacterium]|nr:stage V sporulation protein AD [Syntrophomonadaceae bacterium]
MQTIVFDNPPCLTSWASIVGPKEGEGPWGNSFDVRLNDNLLGEKTWEKAESKLLQDTVSLALSKRGFEIDDVEVFLAGDLLNQLASANFAARTLNIPFLGLYGACSTMAESLIVGAMILDGGFCERVIAATSSHHYSAERQYRFPVEQGVQRSLTAQWTVTGSGAVVLEKGVLGPKIKSATIGKIVDRGQDDANNMGAAMAPVASDTIKMHHLDLNLQPDYYDLVITGDLGSVGAALVRQLFNRDGLVPKPNYSDCGILIFDEKQDVHAGGSGCGCSAVMLCGPLLAKMQRGELNKLLFVATGALMSPTTTFQGETIPCIAHAVAIENQ